MRMGTKTRLGRATRALLLSALVLAAVTGLLAATGGVEAEAFFEDGSLLDRLTHIDADNPLQSSQELTATYQGYTFIEYHGSVYGSTTLSLVQQAPLTTTVVVTESGTGLVVVTSTVMITADVPVSVTVEGQPPKNDIVTIQGSEAVVLNGNILQPNVPITLTATDSPWTLGQLLVNGTGKVTVTGSGLLTGTAPAHLTGFLTYARYLPIITRYVHPPDEIVFFDDFSNPNSGWPRGCSRYCCYDYYNGFYKVTAYKYTERCIIPAPSQAYQVNGTFSVDVTRPYDWDRGIMYGFFFGASRDPDHDRWSLEVRPDRVWNCYNQNPFYWLSYVENGVGHNLTPGQDGCTNRINTGTQWNFLKVIRDGSKVQVYINNNFMTEKYQSVLLNEGYLDLEVISWHDDPSMTQPVTAYFDNFTVSTKVTP